MKLVHDMAAQGDCLFRRVERVPEAAHEIALADGRAIVAHSETGHHHSVDAVDGIRFFEVPDPLICYLVLEGVPHADVVHHRDFDTHETLRLLGRPGHVTTFEVRRQREYKPDGWARVVD